jgi:DNA helicase HerA-like ATPase
MNDETKSQQQGFPRLKPKASATIIRAAGGIAQPGASAQPRTSQPTPVAPAPKPRPKPSMLFSLGALATDPSVAFDASPEQLFGRHCAVIGATGGGKSWTLARLLEECSKVRSKVILVDATGEFFPLSHGVRHVYVGNDPEPTEGSMSVGVPYFHLRESDLVTIFQPSGSSQAPKLRAAMRSLKLARLAPQLSIDGTIMKAHRLKTEFEEQSGLFNSELENPYALFEISHLVRQIQHECVDPFRSAVEPLVWGGVNAMELAQCNSLVSRIQDVITLPQLACIFQTEEIPSLFDEIHTFLKDPVSRILRISLKYVPFDYSAREIVANALARHMLELAREDVFRHLPVVMFVDEAHQFLNRTFEDQLREGAAINSFGLIAKEGRKYGLSLCLATQRPRDIPEDILSQMGTVLVHRLINFHDIEVVEKAAGNMSRALMGTVPQLRSGEALIVGVDFDEPQLVKMHPPECPPFSKSADYQKLWK